MCVWEKEWLYSLKIRSRNVAFYGRLMDHTVREVDTWDLVYPTDMERSRDDIVIMQLLHVTVQYFL